VTTAISAESRIALDPRASFERLRANTPAMARTTAAERRQRLARLGAAIEARRGAIAAAIHADLARPAFETEVAETQHAISEIGYARKHLHQWMKGERVGGSMLLAGTSQRIHYEPRGVVLIIAPWNYPFELLIGPLIAAVAAGNCALVKPSEKSPHVAALVGGLIAEVFDPSEVACATGGPDVSAALLDLPFDHICFTGSTAIGKKVMAAAAQNLATVTLELGGKSPAIVDQTADIHAAADRIAWGKFYNAGQTCIAVDYVLVHASRERELLDALEVSVARFFGATEEARAQSPDLARIIDEGHFQRIQSLVARSLEAGARALTGARYDRTTKYVAPTILSGVTRDMPIMQEEIFGPVLPVLSVGSADDAAQFVRAGDKPLAMYIFAQRAVADRLIAETSSGATVVGGTLLHYASHTVPFGGVGASGQGSYHGVHGFRAFSHARAIVRQREPAISRFMFPPYRGKMHEWMRKLLRVIG
jgi:aldehyde dehydrogenase (NAD+)